MYIKPSLRDFIYFDVETKPKWRHFDDMPPALQKIWLDKYHFKGYKKAIEAQRKKLALNIKVEGSSIVSDEFENFKIEHPTVNDIYIREAGLYPEFSVVLCISFGLFDEKFKITVDTLAEEDDEKQILEDFIKVLNHFKDLNLFGYNITEFDIPFLLKRMWLNGITSGYPPQLQLQGAKPWTIKHVDHMVEYKGLSWMPITLDLMCEILGIPTSKDEFSNADFTTLYNQGKITLKDAVKYCEKDVTATMLVALAFASDKSNYAQKNTYKK